ncbi:hypothetical protein C8Q80DRAFT_1149047 [Daedaleopsis nitida]|nr:hypothetical protein C8Q80DRAFT_1149047 [Daedaleopsis nitida]
MHLHSSVARAHLSQRCLTSHVKQNSHRRAAAGGVVHTLRRHPLQGIPAGQLPSTYLRQLADPSD